MPRLIARYRYVQTASGGKPIVFIGLVVNEKFTVLPAAPAPERMRTGLSPRAGESVDYSDGQRVELQFFRPAAGPAGRSVTVQPELDPDLDLADRVGAPGPRLQYELLRLGQDFLEHFSVGLIGPSGLTVVLEPSDGDPDQASEKESDDGENV
jgi:hypothetical protein